MPQLNPSNRRFCGIELGYPGSGKTGSWACLANAGYKLRIIDLDHNLDPLYEFVKPECYENVEVVPLYDRLRLGTRRFETIQPPTVFANVVNLLSHWKYNLSAEKDTVYFTKLKEGDTSVDLGKPSDWGTDTVLILDSGTALGEAAMRRETFLAPDKAPKDSIYGGAMEDQDGVMAIMGSNHHKCHVIVSFHLKMIGPKLPRGGKGGDSEIAISAKEAAAEMIPTRLYPSALGWLLPPIIGSHFPITILAEARTRGHKTDRVLRTAPCENLDIKIALQGLKEELPVSDGMLQIFNALKGEAI